MQNQQMTSGVIRLSVGFVTFNFSPKRVQTVQTEIPEHDYHD